MGHSIEGVDSAYDKQQHCFNSIEVNKATLPVATLPPSAEDVVQLLKQDNRKYRELDRTVLLAILCSRACIANIGWEKGEMVGVNIGSSRGATNLFEKYHQQYIENGTCPIKSSPQTTLGNISSWVAQDTQSTGPTISHSITCSTGMHALINGAAWIKSGMANKFIVGGSEAAVTPFTIAQMQALKIHAEDRGDEYPCRSMDVEKEKNSMVLGEGAAIACIEKGVNENTLATIEGIGYATEIIDHEASISTNATSLQKAMDMALGDMNRNEVDVVVLHAPGTIKGDQAELNALNKLFVDKMPYLTSNKWKLGHTFAASGMMSLEMGICMIRSQQVVAIPYLQPQSPPAKIKNVLVNAVGFGGDAVSVLISGL